MISEFVGQLSRRHKKAIAILADVIALPVALWCALALRLGQWTPEVAQFWPAFVVSGLVCVPMFGGLGLYRQVTRYMGNHATVAVVKGATITAVVIASVAYMVPLTGFPRSVPVIFWLLTLLYVSGTRFAVRAYFQHTRARAYVREAVIIYGAGRKGVELARLLLQQDTYVPVAFVDENKSLQRRIIDGLHVYSPGAMEDLLKDNNASQVFVATESQAIEERRRIIEFLVSLGARVKLVPDLVDLVSGRQSLNQIRDVDMAAVLGRDEVDPLTHLLAGRVHGRSVMVTGAGGSIGSELCRQILSQEPSRLALMDQSEYGLFEVQRELQRLADDEKLDVPIVPILGSVTNAALMRRSFESNEVETVYHAAAYKHVSLVENNVIQGLKNNTFGTLYAAEAALDAGVRDFILISTDKAVRTSSIMGASKRLAELILQALQETSDETRFSMVRFGNVLGSSGSVVPLFSEQIEHGGPVTVTHPEVTRYFMTIPEAAQLVLQASSMARGGDVFLLDMGQPIKIVDLAIRMIRLKGYTVRDDDHREGDIEINFTGLKSGEKLHEELLVGDDVRGTEHRKIMRAEERFIPWLELRGALNTLEQACDNYDLEAIVSFVTGLVEGGDLESQLGDLSPRAPIVHLHPPEN
ncbi:MAG: nucleoside-diphosphate sugar epimerase/dehydratase [Pseudomonadales bacterium]|mgnify:CR=1 FL=1|jgi:FlaA1/EpsC-like NDP-sugar epimerase|nr:nucleoside-diphosphate sugar epimerase/dehydratase [Pseudomonadales bacterium]MDP6472079.1 nucleoside-diphosphate sugar epimerase/dehydratase [Pseudomonadales bacterium]MDP6826648.1 nucleoside-diphosphate sugar epimerase/dehydratase [Pseudomonadales bacterium]MDP6969991.1 nucleoside-diphosphate sugar epimerase/dehydratase [Pseudomonadales bacterium]|tara:strand:- start:262 stop:2181 length:1920 start_codon:yes stop_codon:yes gene_type:complete